MDNNSLAPKRLRRDQIESDHAVPLMLLVGLAMALMLVLGLLGGYILHAETTFTERHVEPAPTGPRLAVPLGPVLNNGPTGASESCPFTGTHCAAELLAAVNARRGQIGVPPLRLDWTLAHHQDTCISADDHAQHLVAVVTSWGLFGQYAHDQFTSSCALRAYPAGQNVGATPGSKWDAILGTYNLMMAEGHQPLGSCQLGHDCNLMYGAYGRVGFAFRRSGALQAWIVVMDFAGP